MADLPPPSSGQFLEIVFRRLLDKCEHTAAGEGAHAWQSSPLFHHVCVFGIVFNQQPSIPYTHIQNVETLQEQLADLTSTRRYAW